MTIDARTLKDLVENEWARTSDERIISHVRNLLVEPRIVMRHWDYGEPGQRFACWTVLEDPESGAVIAYCESGFGPRQPWGLVREGDEAELPGASIGSDSGWYSSFLDAFFESFAAVSLPIWRVFSMKGGAPDQALTDELGWDA